MADSTEARMKMAKLTISCAFCSEAHTVELDMPAGWKLRYDGIDEETAFCPKHSPVAEFAASQCPGCVGGWGDCSLWQGFAFGHSRDLTEKDFAALESGICPRRTNGTISFDAKSRAISEVNLSERAPVESGKALAAAIREYWRIYQ